MWNGSRSTLSTHPVILETKADVFTIDQLKILSGTIVVLIITGKEYQMATPLKVPLTNTIPPADDRPQPTDRESVAAILIRQKKCSHL